VSKEEDASSRVTAGATAHTTEGNSRTSFVWVVVFTFTRGIYRCIYYIPFFVTEHVPKPLWVGAGGSDAAGVAAAGLDAVAPRSLDKSCKTKGEWGG